MVHDVDLKSKIIDEYWMKKLSPQLPKEMLPAQNTSAESSVEGTECWEAVIPVTILRQLEQVSGGSELARLIVLLTAVSGLLCRYNEHGESLIGTTTLRQSGQEGGQVLYLRNRVEQGQPWKTLLEAMHAELSRSFNHRGLPLEQVKERLLTLPGFRTEVLQQIAVVDEGLQTSPDGLMLFPLVVKWKCSDSTQGQILQFIFDPNLYDAAIIRSFAANLVHVLGALTMKPLASLDAGECPMLASTECEILLTTLNNTFHTGNSVRLLHQFLEEQAARMPDQTALVQEDRKVTYRELNRRANGLAGILREYGVRPEQIVGIVVRQSIEMIIAINAVLKAGGAYCPLDPELPQERLQQMMEDSGIEFVLTIGAQPELAGPWRIIDITIPFVTGCEADNLPTLAAPHHLAYVLYTSGSTGRPKGVMIEHRSIVNQIAGLMLHYSFDASLRHVLLAPYTFDPSVQQVFLPLATGGTLYLISRTQITDPDCFWDLVCEEKINVINTVPSLMEVLMEQTDGLPHQLDYVIMAGESFTHELACRLKQRFDIRFLFNIYGPTEATINTTLYEWHSGSNHGTVPIGKPLTNYQVYVLDAEQRLLPYGASGELYIGGAGLARGYINRPELTSKAFIAHPFRPGARLYRTGDIVRWLPDGHLQFIRRIDHQVKINGMRVELGEIESVLREYPGIKEVALVHGVSANSTELAAFYTRFSANDKSAADITQESLTAHLRRFVPEYMVPVHFVELARMPMTVNGKTDKSALKVPRRMNGLAGPRNAVEEKLIEIWRKLLGGGEFGIHSSFFESGGNSLSVVRLQSRINQAFDVKLTISQLFTHHTIACQAEVLRSSGREKVNVEREGLRAVQVQNSERVADSNGSRLSGNNDIAVIGIACRFPHAASQEEFWDNLCRGVDSVGVIPQQRLQDILPGIAVSDEYGASFPRGAYLERIDTFDPQFFQISPNEAAMMDPQQRLFLQVVWEAFQDAGYGEKEVFGSRTGVFAGTGKPKYLELMEQIEPSAIPGNLQAAIAGRIAYTFNLTGPAEVIDTACSSSLVAVHHAVQELLLGGCDMAIAGGVNLYLSMVDQNIYEMGIASPDGRAKTFDHSANGTGGGEGGGAVLLKPLQQAVADGDHIYAVIKASAVNSDGRSGGITAPNAAAQSLVIEEAWRRAELDPETVTYIEAHGTGTRLGDPVEVEGIASAFRKYTERKQFCAVGSVKTNIGHLDAAAGIAGFIKAALAVFHGYIPASLHFTLPNPHIDFSDMPVYVADSGEEWRPECGVRRAGVSSFGLSGTNCHAILEDYFIKPEPFPAEDVQLFTLSAWSAQALLRYVDRFLQFLPVTAASLADICYCSSLSRSAYTHRLAVTVNSVQDLQRKLVIFRTAYLQDEYALGTGERDQISWNQLSKTDMESAQAELKPNASLWEVAAAYLQGVAIDWRSCYRGQARRRVPLPAYPFEQKRCWTAPAKVLLEALAPVTPEYAADVVKASDFLHIPGAVFRMGGQLLAEGSFGWEPEYKANLDHFAVQLILQFFRSYGLFNDQNIYSGQEIMHKTRIAPPYQRLVSYMLSFLNQKGCLHSEGDIHSLTGVYSSLDVKDLCAEYCRQYPELAGSFQILKHCFQAYPDVLSGKRSPLSVLFPDGTSHFLQSFANRRRTLGDLHEILAMDALQQHITVLAQLHRPVRILEVGGGSGTIGKAIFSGLAGLQVEYCFTDIGRSIVLEASKQFKEYPFVQYQVFNIEEDPLIQGFKPGQFDIIVGLNVIHATRNLRCALSQLKKIIAAGGVLYLIEKVLSEPGENLVWGLTEGWWHFEDTDIRQATPLLSAPAWEKLLHEEQFADVRSYSLELAGTSDTESGTALIIGSMGKTLALPPEELMYEVRWLSKKPDAEPVSQPGGVWLIFRDELGIGEHLSGQLMRLGCSIITVDKGSEFNFRHSNRFTIDAGEEVHYIRLMNILAEQGRQISGVIHLWACTACAEVPDSGTADLLLQAGLYSVTYLTRAMLNFGTHDEADIRVVTDHAVMLAGDQAVSPGKSSILGLVKVISQEHPKLRCYALDVDTGAYSAEEVSALIMKELAENKNDGLVAFRQERLVQELARFNPKNYPRQEFRVREDGIYIVTGGLGRLGMEICRYLSREKPVKLVIISRSVLPDKLRWRQCLEHPAEGIHPSDMHKLASLLELEDNTGSEIHYFAGDVADEQRMREIMAQVRRIAGSVHGVIHCAAAPGACSQPLKIQTQEKFRQVLRPKIQGTLVLDSLLAQDPLDFFVVYSSVASLWGGVGGADYAAANAFLDAFSASRNARGKNTLAVNWYAWEGLTDPGCMGYMPPGDALAALRIGLSSRMDQVVIGKFDPHVLAEWAPMMKIRLAPDVIRGTSSGIRPVKAEPLPGIAAESLKEVLLTGRSDGEFTVLEKQISLIWAQVLGYEEFDVNDNFFDIGGDSLLILKVLSLVNAQVDAEVEAGDLFSYGTIARLAQFIGDKRAVPQAAPEQPSWAGSTAPEDDALRRLIKSVKNDGISVGEAMKGFEEL